MCMGAICPHLSASARMSEAAEGHKAGRCGGRWSVVTCMKPKTPGFRSGYFPRLSITWRGRLNGPNHAGAVGAQWKTEQQLAAEGDGLADH